MKTSGRNRFSYNAQAVADQKEGVIVASEVSRQETDFAQLTTMVQEAHRNTGVEAQAPLTLADQGYGSGHQIQKALEKGYPVLVPPMEGKVAKENPYATKHFRYDPAKRSVTCPRGEVLDYEGQTKQEDLILDRYRCHCKDCPVRSQCTKDPKGRRVEISPHTAATQNMRDRLDNPAIYKQWSQRKEIIERIFGQIKEHDGFRAGQYGD